MIVEESPVVSIVRLVERMPLPPLPTGRGRPCIYEERLIVKALVVMLLKRLPTVHSLLDVLAEPTLEMQWVRAHLTDAQGRFPSRRTWERRLARLTDRLPKLISTLGAFLLGLLQPWPHGGQAAADYFPCQVPTIVGHANDADQWYFIYTHEDIGVHSGSRVGCPIMLYKPGRSRVSGISSFQHSFGGNFGSRVPRTNYALPAAQ